MRSGVLRQHRSVTVLFYEVGEARDAAVTIIAPSDVLNGDGVVADLRKNHPETLILSPKTLHH